jgi:membrane glycosyltransferase
VPDIATRRWLYLFLVLGSAALASIQLWSVLRIDGLRGSEVLILFLFTLLFAWIASSFWLACFGAFAKLTARPLLSLKPGLSPGLSRSRTAIIMPVYNEDVAGVFAGVQAIYESVSNTPGFDFYILSDSTDPAHWVAEELQWQRLRQEFGENIYYRHRSRNIGRKSGNIQDFCENWGQLYDYMVILDADSLMTGGALMRLVAMMDANPRAALIQVPALLVGRSSLFARILQFSASVYGPIWNAGLAFLQGPDGNYWGHNAIIRVHAFMRHCGLPRLPGKAPFGGEIMSHDFVEAAFLRRAGWEVWMADELGGSFEEPPPTISDYLKRDRRWCQGNLQHLRIVFAQGLKMPSRLHLVMGIMSYVSSPLWLLLLIVSSVDMMSRRPHPPASYTGTYIGGLQPSLSLSVSHTVELVPLVLAAAVILYGPKLLAAVLLLRERGAVRDHGGFLALLAGVIGESVFSTLLAPIMMLQHSWFVFNILIGRSTGWGTQQRQDRALPLGFVVRNFLAHTLIGAAVAVVLLRYGGRSFVWFVPLLAGLLLSIPLVALTSSLKLGERLRAARLFLAASETRDIPVLSRAHALAAGPAGEARDPRALVLEDGEVRKLHLALLSDAPALLLADRSQLALLLDSARRRDTESFSLEDWRALLSDPESLRTLGA